MRSLDRSNAQRMEAQRQVRALRQHREDDRLMRVRIRELASEITEQRLRITNRYGEART